MKVNFRQGIVSHQSGGFLQISGGIVSILANNRPVTITLAQKNVDYAHSEDNTVNNAWLGPFTETNYWLYWNFNPLTFERTFGHTTLEPVSQATPPGSGNAPITGAIPGDAGFGALLVDQYYNLPNGKPFVVINSSVNNGNYTVNNVSYNPSTGKTTINVNEAVASNVADGEATLDLDSAGDPLYVTGRHWYNTTTNVHSVLNGNTWQPVIRVFAAQLFNGTTLISYSQNSQFGDFTGTQIGNNSDIFAGRILFDEASDPIRRDDGTFFTTEDQFFTNQSRVDALRLESNVSRAQCIATSLSEFSVVAWTNDGQITAAQYDDVGATVVGLLTENLTNLEVGAVIVQGTVTNPLWNWTQGTTPTPVGSELWVENGLLVTVDPHVSDPVTYQKARVPVARVLDKDTVIFEQGLGGIGERGPVGAIAGLPPADTTNLGGVTLLSPSSDPLRAFVISDTDSRLTNARSPLPHTHQAVDVAFQPGGGVSSNDIQSAIVELGVNKLSISGGVMTGQLTLSGNPTATAHATTKQYVDNLVNGLIWLEPIDGVNIINDSIAIEPLNPNIGDSYILPSDVVATGSPLSTWAGLTDDVIIWDGVIWNNIGQIETIHTGTIRVGIAMQSTTVPGGTFLNKKNQIAIYDTLGVFQGFEVPANNNAVYVDGDASLFAFDQYAFDGIKWVRFGGSNQAIVADGLTTTISGGTISVIPATSSGQVDALTLIGNSLTDLDARWAAISHTHNAAAVSVTPYAGDGSWGTTVDTTAGQIVAATVDSAINYLADTKASKAPLYSTVANLPSASTEKGMLATVDDDNTVYFAADSGWSALSRSDHVHNLPYDMAFYVHGTLLALQKIGIFAITRDVFVPAGASESLAVAGKPASSLPTTLIITREQSPYSGAPITVGSVTFDPGSTVGNITWTANTAFVAGDLLILSTDSSPSDLEQVSITLTGCSVAYACTLPAAPTVIFTPGSVALSGTSPIIDGDGTVTITGLWNTITWTQPRYSTDGTTFVAAPGTISDGDLIFDNSTIQYPTVNENTPALNYWYEVTITVTGPGGVASDTKVVNFA